MQEEARNSLLKLLEEPPGRLRLVLCSSSSGSLPSTVLSRLRPYRFYARDKEVEKEVIRRVFKDPSGEAGIGAYLDSFLPISSDTLEELAAYFAASVAYKAALLSKKRPHPEELVLLGKYSASRAAGLGRPQEDSSAVIALILEKAQKFELRQLFSRFLSCLLEQVSSSHAAFLPAVPYNELWRKCCNWAETASRTYNLRPAQVLEKLFLDLSRGMASLSEGSAL